MAMEKVKQCHVCGSKRNHIKRGKVCYLAICSVCDTYIGKVEYETPDSFKGKRSSNGMRDLLVGRKRMPNRKFGFR